MRKIVLFLSIFLMAVSTALAQNNTVIFDNQSGEPALVKLIGPTSKEVEVPDDAKQGVDASAGRYIIKVRYGTPGKFHYSKGQEFEVTETATARSETTITLHKVVSGNYDAKPISEQEFGKAGANSLATSRTSGEEKKIFNADEDSARFVVTGTLVGDLPFGSHTVVVQGSCNRSMMVSRGGSLYASGIAAPDANGRFKAEVYRAGLLRQEEELCLTLQVARGMGGSFTTESYKLLNTNGVPVVFRFAGADKQLDVGRVMIKKP